ncbi:phosphoglycerate mutase family member 5 isoform X2 [Nasonia vitripennis]|uniref:Serine/threonine-protein phosphatase PGAM5, mitochondrial n=1 Tax=Nasonia vitripennis TaxID=7425 RepID=A0A7M7Q6B0_NASVI|nr:phosphoglycerate mutase family member 5 isoform X2 [Nasonia vitripennis]
MTKFSKFQKLSAVIVGVVISGIIYHTSSTNSLFGIYLGKSLSNSLPLSKWNHNWDRQDVRSGSKVDKEKLQNSQYTIKASRHIILIRHGQYNTQGKSDNERNLTNLGKLQAEVTGMRLAELSFRYTTIVRSTMTRARETSECIQSHLPTVPVKEDCLLIEGFPIPPDPASGHWKPEKIFFQDGPRMEAAFRKYFHRAEQFDKHDTYTIIVCHANIIRYFVCRFFNVYDVYSR